MKRRRFSVEQIVGVLKQAEAGTPMAELIRHVGISEQTFLGGSSPAGYLSCWEQLRAGSSERKRRLRLGNVAALKDRSRAR